MTFIFEQAQPAFAGTMAGGQASFGAIFDAIRQGQRRVDNANSRDVAVEDAYQQRIDAIAQATGVTLQHPLLRFQSALADGDIPAGSGERDSLGAVPNTDNILQFFIDDFDRQLAELSKQRPEHAETIGAGRSIFDEARDLSRAADLRAGQVMQSEGNFLSKWGAALSGGMVGALRDPLQAGTFLLGAGPGAARSVAGRILGVSTKEFAVNSSVEAALQPEVQRYRAELGLDHGFGEAARNVAFAGILGAAFGGATQTGVEVVSKVARQQAVETAFDQVRGALPDDSPLAQIDSLSGEATAQLLEPIRGVLPGETRGAIDLTDTLRHIEDYRIARMTDDELDAAAHAGIRFAENVDAGLDLIGGARDQILRELRPQPPAKRRPVSLLRFLTQEGGLARGGRGELDDLDVFVGGRGGGPLLRRNGGLPIDQARELAAEAGYIRGFGSNDDAMLNSTDDDLIRLLRDEVAGNQVFSQSDDDIAAKFAEFDNGMQRQIDDIDRALSELGETLVNDVPLEIKRRAVELRTQGENIDDALERAIIEAHNEMPDPPAVRADDGDEIPFFDDEVPDATVDDQRAGSQRISVSPGSGDGRRGAGGPFEGVGPQFRDTGHTETRPPEPDGGLDDVARGADDPDLDAELAGVEADAEIPILFGDDPDGPVRIGLFPDALDEAERPGVLAEIVNACKV